MQAAEAMIRDAVTVGPETTVAEAARLMRASGHSNLPVTDESGQFLGVIGTRDIVGRCLPPYLSEVGDLYRSGEFQPFIDKGREVADLPVTAVMKAPVPTAHEDTPLAEIASLMTVHHVHLMPVVRDGLLVGVIGMQDIVDKLAAVAFTSGRPDS